MLSREEKSSKVDLCSGRHYLITRIIFDNALRQGAVSNMTVKEYNEAKFKEGEYVVSVEKHKTA